MSQSPRTEDGIAMITAALVSMVVLILAMMALSLADHNSSASALDRGRVQAVHAAEAGVHRVTARIQRSKPSELPCTVTGEMKSSPRSLYAVNVGYWLDYPPDPSIPPLPCPMADTDPPPGAALIESVGTGFGVSEVRRTMQMQVRLTPVFGAFSDKAIFSDSLGGTFTVGNNTTIYGDTGADGDIYTNGNFVCSNNVTIKGSIYAQGTGTLANDCILDGSLWTRLAMTLNQKARVKTDATSSESSITLNGPGGWRAVDVDATAGTNCVNCVVGTTVGNSVTVNKIQAPPPYEPFPALVYRTAKWTADGYNEVVFDGVNACTDARTYIEGDGGAGLSGATTKTVVRINQPTASDPLGARTCMLTFSNNETITLPHDLAIVSEGAIVLSQRTVFTSSGDKSLHLIVPYSLPGQGGSDPPPPDPTRRGVPGPTGDPDACDTPWGYGSPPQTFGSVVVSPGDIFVGNNIDLDNGPVFLYSPCRVTVQNENKSFEGQVFGGQVNIANRLSFTYSPFDIPGTGIVSGFQEDIAFLREISTTAP